MKKSLNGEGSVYFVESENRWIHAYHDLAGKRRVKRYKTRTEAEKAKRDVVTSMERGEYVEASAITVEQWLFYMVERIWCAFHTEVNAYGEQTHYQRASCAGVFKD